MNTEGILVFAGNANRPLAQTICRELGVPLGKAVIGRFSDGEVQVEIEENVRRQEVFVVQPTCAPTADNFMELLVLIDALKRASAASVTAVIPYFGYARQDRRPRSARVAITAKVAAKMIGAVGTDPSGGTHIGEFEPARFLARRIATAEHCFGCTAGAGSSCGTEIWTTLSPRCRLLRRRRNLVPNRPVNGRLNRLVNRRVNR